MENMMFDVTRLIEALVELALLAVTMLLIPWLKAKLSAEQETKLRTAIEIGVLAAEKLYGAGRGDEKLKYVEDYLAKRGVKVDAMRIKAYVNAAIKKMEQADPASWMGEAITEAEEEEEEEPQTEGAPKEV